MTDASVVAVGTPQSFRQQLARSLELEPDEVGWVQSAIKSDFAPDLEKEFKEKFKTTEVPFFAREYFLFRTEYFLRLVAEVCWKVAYFFFQKSKRASQ